MRSSHENLSKVTAALQTRPIDRYKQYFSVKLWNHTKNCTNILKGLIQILGMQVFSRDGRKSEAQEQSV